MAEKGKTKKKQNKSKQYEVTDTGAKRKSPFCPKCGAGVFLASHATRLTCGKCGYTQWTKK